MPIVLFGDSLMQGAAELQDGFSFQGKLQHRCMRRFDVVNRGFSGYNTANALRFLPEIFSPASESTPKIDYLFVLLGANDSILPLPRTIQHVPIDKYKENLVKIVTHPIITSHKPQIFIVTPPPIDQIHTTRRDNEWGHTDPQRLFEVTAAYAVKAREVAREVPGVKLADLWQAVMDRAAALTPGYEPGGLPLGTPECGIQGGLEKLLYDGLHMSGEAYRVFYDLVAPLVEAEWAKAPEEERVGYIFPDWRLINPPQEQE